MVLTSITGKVKTICQQDPKLDMGHRAAPAQLAVPRFDSYFRPGVASRITTTSLSTKAAAIGVVVTSAAAGMMLRYTA
jgi:hypothetical protein